MSVTKIFLGSDVCEQRVVDQQVAGPNQERLGPAVECVY